MLSVAFVLCALSAVGSIALAMQLLAARAHCRDVPAASPAHSEPISILKPLCGVDDDLEANLASFAAIPYPVYEVLLGVKDDRDPAYAVARAAAARWPDRMRVVLQRGPVGRNPKVNQLVTLAAEARHDVLLVSDSNTRVRPGYLAEIADCLADRSVGLVTSPLVGTGARRWGSLMDNLQVTGGTAPGVIGAKRLCGYDVVVGKSMALRRADLRRLGGFESARDVLAEDWWLGRRVVCELGKRVALGRTPVENVSRDAPVSWFLRRYRRWSIIHRQAVGPVVYASEGLLNPVFLAMAAALAGRTPWLAASLASACAGKIIHETMMAKALGRPRYRARELLAVVPKDVLWGMAWLGGWFSTTIDWRGNRLRVGPGTRLYDPSVSRADAGVPPVPASAPTVARILSSPS